MTKKQATEELQRIGLTWDDAEIVVEEAINRGVVLVRRPIDEAPAAAIEVELRTGTAGATIAARLIGQHSAEPVSVELVRRECDLRRRKLVDHLVKEMAATIQELRDAVRDPWGWYEDQCRRAQRIAKAMEKASRILET